MATPSESAESTLRKRYVEISKRATQMRKIIGYIANRDLLAHSSCASSSIALIYCKLLQSICLPLPTPPLSCGSWMDMDGIALVGMALSGHAVGALPLSGQRGSEMYSLDLKKMKTVDN
ncbi:unnamed protein product [Coregonus sp. 'balchen']|nr:unnamed protein product [Coregonus sp. 'balchen']